jgi:hypothetical protein
MREGGQVSVIQFRINFEVDSARADEFEKMVHDIYGPALTRQQGFVAWRLLRPYQAEDAMEGGETVQLALEFEFDTEQDRLTWAASSDHAPAWEAAVAMARGYQAHGFDVLEAAA